MIRTLKPFQFFYLLVLDLAIFFHDTSHVEKFIYFF
jgi:hypothetical protein